MNFLMVTGINKKNRKKISQTTIRIIALQGNDYKINDQELYPLDFQLAHF